MSNGATIDEQAKLVLVRDLEVMIRDCKNLVVLHVTIKDHLDDVLDRLNILSVLPDNITTEQPTPSEVIAQIVGALNNIRLQVTTTKSLLDSVGWSMIFDKPSN